MTSTQPIEELSLTRLYILRAMYCLIVVGLALTALPEVISSNESNANAYTVINSMLAAFCALAILGVRYPIKMIPILLMELFWKTLWVIAFAIPDIINGKLDEFGSSVLIACVMGIVLTPLVIPWKYVFFQYIQAPAEPWK